MKAIPRLISLVAIACLLTLFIYPLWQITLVAPQYPDGVTMYIWINKITGDTPGTLQNINILNHYVGMKHIIPAEIPELTYFPWVVIGLAVYGLLAAIINKKNFYLSWALIFLVLAGLGIYDFYLWEYNYGHDLSPTAPIKVPGQAYQPPLIGSKMLLNFEAISFPGTGGILMGVALALSFVSYWFRRKFDSGNRKKSASVNNNEPQSAETTHEKTYTSSYLKPVT